MQKHPMVTVKEAAAALGMDERSVREKLALGQLKGEKKTIGMKDKWFVYKGEIDAALARKGATQAPPGEQTNFEPSTEDAVVNVEAYATTDDEDRSGRDWLGPEREAMRILAEEMVKPLVETIKQQTEALTEKDRIIKDQGQQLRLLPDLEKRAEEERKAAELRALEVEALKKQISALEESKEQSESRLAAMDQERQTAEEAQAKVQELEKAMSGLNSKLEELQKPWWKRWFSAGGEYPAGLK